MAEPTTDLVFTSTIKISWRGSGIRGREIIEHELDDLLLGMAMESLTRKITIDAEFSADWPTTRMSVRSDD